ncbi:hypothetical protein WAI453_002207 [Rhynchosporium graminicola]|uniref:Uncharacterized protein n=1 Tax=Rhynchosporium graminicola TaxID=2792576 RepID=A0A1E1LCD0_9HELO|nr:uncharacterized protein RCO7_09337 [Rhynchosporium commune]
MTLSKAPKSDEIVGSTIYLTFNRPHTDNCHRSILCTNPATQNDPVSGNLFHVENDTDPAASKGIFTEYARSGKWSFRERRSRNPAGAESLFYAQKIGNIAPSLHDKVLDKIRKALTDVPIGKENREAKLGKLGKGEGNLDLDGYDCVIWTIDAMRKLSKEGIIKIDEDAAVLMAEARISAWPGPIEELIAQSSRK